MTNKIVLRTVEQLMQDYVPVYNPIYPLLLGKSQTYAAEVGQLNFKRVQTIGDIRQKRLTPKDTEMAQIGANDFVKGYKKYFFGNQYQQSNYQDLQGNEDVIKQVLDEHHRQADSLFLYGDSPDAGTTIINNGLYYSNDVNYVLNNSLSIAAGSSSDHLADFHKQICAQAAIANQVSGRKIILVYGTASTALLDALYATSNAPFSENLLKVLNFGGQSYSIIKMPVDVLVASAEGFIIANMDQVKTHYTLLPELHAQGVNEEKMYTWHNFAMGSMMMEVQAKYGVIRQDVTYA